MVRGVAFAMALVVFGAAVALAAEKLEGEERDMARLAQVQTDPAVELSPFTSDGCSGGMSTSWGFAVKHFKGFEEKFGKSPPWAACCLAHDRAYWRGETEDGVRLRKEMDAALKACVIETGRANKAELSAEFKISEEAVKETFTAIAGAMYGAVRLGGAPCTGLPWRWGYGWPDCK